MVFSNIFTALSLSAFICAERDERPSNFFSARKKKGNLRAADEIRLITEKDTEILNAPKGAVQLMLTRN